MLSARESPAQRRTLGRRVAWGLQQGRVPSRSWATQVCSASAIGVGFLPRHWGYHKALQKTCCPRLLRAPCFPRPRPIDPIPIPLRPGHLIPSFPQPANPIPELPDPVTPFCPPLTQSPTPYPNPRPSTSRPVPPDPVTHLGSLKLGHPAIPSVAPDPSHPSLSLPHGGAHNTPLKWHLNTGCARTWVS